MTKWIAHRGVSAIAPENTLAAFTLAWAHDVDGIECDIQVTQDDMVVVHHDYTTERCGDRALVIAESDYADLSKVDVGSFKSPQFADQRIPTLAAVLQAMPTSKTIQVEIKPEVVKIEPIIAALKVARKDINLIIMSFNPQLLKQVMTAIPMLTSLWLLDEKEAREDDVFAQARNYGFSGIDVNYKVVDQAYVDKAKAYGLLLGVWTVNNAEIAENFTTWGIDMLASDYAPALLK